MTGPEEVQSRMLALAKAQPLPALCEALLVLEAKDKMGDAERMARVTLMDAICAKSPAADAAFERWADSDDDPRSAVEAIVTAVRMPETLARLRAAMAAQGCYAEPSPVLDAEAERMAREDRKA